MKQSVLAAFGLSLLAAVSATAEDTKQVPPPKEGLHIEERITVTSSKNETELINSQSTLTPITADVLATHPAQDLPDVIRSAVPGVNVIQTSARDFNITPRQTRPRWPTPARPSRRPLDLPRFLRPGALGLPAPDTGRHQADRGRARTRVGRLGRQRPHRRRQHRDEDAARSARLDGHVQRRRFQSRRGLAIGRRAGGAVRRERQRGEGARAGSCRTACRRLLLFRSAAAADRKSRSVRIRAIRPAAPPVGGAIYPVDPYPADSRHGFQNDGHEPAEVRPARRPGTGRAGASPTRAACGGPGIIHTGDRALRDPERLVLGYGKVASARRLKVNLLRQLHDAEGAQPAARRPRHAQARCSSTSRRRPTTSRSATRSWSPGSTS